MQQLAPALVYYFYTKSKCPVSCHKHFNARETKKGIHHAGKPHTLLLSCPVLLKIGADLDYKVQSYLGLKFYTYRILFRKNWKESF